MSIAIAMVVAHFEPLNIRVVTVIVQADELVTYDLVRNRKSSIYGLGQG